MLGSSDREKTPLKSSFPDVVREKSFSEQCSQAPIEAPSLRSTCDSQRAGLVGAGLHNAVLLPPCTLGELVTTTPEKSSMECSRSISLKLGFTPAAYKVG